METLFTCSDNGYLYKFSGTENMCEQEEFIQIPFVYTIWIIMNRNDF